MEIDAFDMFKARTKTVDPVFTFEHLPEWAYPTAHVYLHASVKIW